MIKQNSTFTRLKPLFTTVLFATIASYSSMASASLSSTPATPNQIKIVAKAATADQIKAQLAYKASAKAKSPTVDNTSANSATQKVNKIYRKWAGTRYRLGGEGHNGIDCSAFVQKQCSVHLILICHVQPQNNVIQVVQFQNQNYAPAI
ncbi:lipoprotein [Actinobacillus equuli]|nr:lipoprotein [Actinobacillus equuli]